MLRKCVGCVLLVLLNGTMHAGRPDEMVWRNVKDYTYFWWKDGVTDGSKILNIQTSRYGAVFDCYQFKLKKIGAFSSPPTEQKALVAHDGRVDTLPSASIRCIVENDGNRFSVIGAGPDIEDVMVIESGKFFERRWFDKVIVDPLAPDGRAHAMITAWPDRMSFVFYFTPQSDLSDGAIEITIDIDREYSNVIKQDGAYALSHQNKSDGYVFLTDSDDAEISYDPSRSTCTVRVQPKEWKKGKECSVGIVVYPVASCNEDAFAAICRKEEPLTITAVQTEPVKHTLDVDYQKRYGWYRIGLRNDKFTDGDESSNDRIEKVEVDIENPSESSREIRINFDKEIAHAQGMSATGLSAILCDSDGFPMGIPVQLSKNWHETDAYDNRFEGKWFHGLTMLTVPAKTTLRIIYTSVNAHWGGVPAASHSQLCLVGWGQHRIWEEAAIGAWGESLCFWPVSYERWAPFLNDARPLMVWAMNADEPRKWIWTNNVGGGDFLVYYDGHGRRQTVEKMKVMYNRYCPNLTEVTYAGVTEDAKIDVQYTVRMFRSDDIVRGIFDLRYDINDTIKVASQPKDNRHRVAFFQLGSDYYNLHQFEEIAIGHLDGIIEKWSPPRGGQNYSRTNIVCAGDVPWFSLHKGISLDSSDYGAWANRGLVIRNYTAKLNGTINNIPHASVYGTVHGYTDSANIELSVPAHITELRKGDYIEAKLEYLVVPQFAADYYGPNKHLKEALKKYENSPGMIKREAKGNNITVSADVGTVREHYPIRIETTQNKAEFTIKGGLGYVPVTFSNLEDYREIIFERRVDGKWIAVDQSVHGKDYWQSDYDPEKERWEITYNVPLDTINENAGQAAFRLYRRGQ